ncbi:dTDP-4-dehydrorhamnose reductase [Hoeflea poritis]|uniref:dTDP-4-dehydrorhamnose reductase n=1 Tax=Hoeflea poritis TaxID=2993659 RepID=A0ABT4VPC0_9HYPH|nr:dTDP-4-dehydrorhamnose reductase [Hoeflea poritis]MDA4846559.1 dTDP-4-dehydrorhamnose reductase [Hoeflea poritis]
MRILVTGTKGQVSRCLQDMAQDRGDVELVAVGRPELDLLKPAEVRDVVARHRPDVVVSAAAYTGVDQAEDEPDIAFAVNETGAGAVAAAARVMGAPVIHLSTDYVFSGELDRPYREDDQPDPQSVYGASKLAGERAVAAANEQHIILRTSWVYSPYGKNFRNTMLRLAETRDEIPVVDDQIGNPTSAHEIADTILSICLGPLAQSEVTPWGVFHLAGKEAMSWADFAEKIMRESSVKGGPFAKIRRITSAEYPTRARRPMNSRLAASRLAACFPKAGKYRSRPAGSDDRPHAG